MTLLELGMLADLGELTLTEGKSFEALTTGTFLDMHGQVVKITEAKLQELVDNTNAYIQAGSKDGNGSPVGLPIDIRKHENGDAAGWIQSAQLVGKVVHLLPKWTELGLAALSKGIQRLFSATVDLDSWCIRGGSLTNWPAVKGLRAVELQELAVPDVPHLYDLAMMPDESTGEYEARVTRAFGEAYPERNENGKFIYYYPMRVYSDYLVCSRGGELYKVGLMQKKGGAVTFSPESDWPKVRMVPVEMSVDPQGFAFKTEAELAQEDSMPTMEEIMEEVRKEQKASEDRILLALQKSAGTVPAPAKVDLAENAEGSALAVLAALGMDKVPAELQEKFVEAMDNQMKAFQAKAETTFKARMAELAEANRLSGVVAQLTQTGISGKALPIQAERMTRFLGALTPAVRKEAEAIFSEVLKTSLVDLAEIGTDGTNADKAKKPQLPPELIEDLNRGRLKLADLETPEVAPLLGGRTVEEFDLTAWKK